MSAYAEDDVADAGVAEALLDFLEEERLERTKFLNVGRMGNGNRETPVAERSRLAETRVDLTDKLGPTREQLRFPEALVQSDPFHDIGHKLSQ
jgi:hypothetical protein